MDQPTDRSPAGDGAPAPAAQDAPVGFEHLGWSPTWRDRLDAVVGGGASGRVAMVAVGAVVIAVAAIVALRGPAPPPPELTLPVAGGPGDPGASATTTTSIASETTAPATEVVVHAAGSVSRPGVYRFAAGARVSELLDAAGGPAPDADLDRLNLAAPLVDGDRVYVPTIGGEVPDVVGGAVPAPAGPAGSGAGTGHGPVDVNTATAEQLETLPGVGPATAQAILDERARRGRFTSVEDLLDVRGIGEAKLAAIRDRVRV